MNKTTGLEYSKTDPSSLPFQGTLIMITIMIKLTITDTIASKKWKSQFIQGGNPIIFINSLAPLFFSCTTRLMIGGIMKVKDKTMKNPMKATKKEVDEK